jgi:hypothetical protein
MIDSTTAPQDEPIISVSIIIEWENATRIGAARALRMLATVHDQLADSTVTAFGAAELIILYPIGDAVPAMLKDAVTRIRQTGVACRIVPTAITDYYQQKNAGAAIARGDLLVFLDSDVVPRAGWLRHLLTAIRDPRVAVVGGATTIDHYDFYSRALALIWIFPLPPITPNTRPTHFFWANNFVARRNTFLRYRFPDTGQYRGQCSMLADTMRRDGLTLLMNDAALVGHPPPAASDLLRRGYHSGADLVPWLRVNSGPSPWWQGTKIVAHDILVALRRIRTERREVGLGHGGAIAAIGVTGAYYAARALGFGLALARIRPERW